MGTQAAPLVTGLEVVYLYVKDMERSARFYRDLLGIPLAGDAHWQDARLGDTRFALHEWHESVPEPSSGTVSIDFRVDDADAAAERLRAEGVGVQAQMREEYGITYELLDPDGYSVHLFSMPR